MTTDLSRESPAPVVDVATGGNCMELLQTMDREDFLEILLFDDVFCRRCQDVLHRRIQDLVNKKVNRTPFSIGCAGALEPVDMSNISSSKNYKESPSSTQGSHLPSPYRTPESVYYAKQNEQIASSSPSINIHQKSNVHLGDSEILLNDGLSDVPSVAANGLTEDQKEQIRISRVGRNKDFVCTEKVNGKRTNILEGLQLHTKVFNTVEQKKIVECVYDLQKSGQKGQLRERTYSEPTKWMRGKGRITMQFGCCYNYAMDKDRNAPGIIRDEVVDPLPPIFKEMIKRMVRWHVLPPACIPNSCIVNIYEEGDCIPPHIDHHDFIRPFCTVSFLTKCNIVFGSNLKIVSPGEFSGPVSIPLPVGSVLVLNGNGADVAKHCIPGVPEKRISITFRKMNDSKLPYNFLPEPELSGIKPLMYSPLTKTQYRQSQHQKTLSYHSVAKLSLRQNQDDYWNSRAAAKEPEGASNTPFSIGNEDFPPLGSSNASTQRKIH